MSFLDENDEAKLGTAFRFTLAVVVVSVGGHKSNKTHQACGHCPISLAAT
jgi:hypothetical protein